MQVKIKNGVATVTLNKRELQTLKDAAALVEHLKPYYETAAPALTVLPALIAELDGAAE